MRETIVLFVQVRNFHGLYCPTTVVFDEIDYVSHYSVS